MIVNNQIGVIQSVKLKKEKRDDNKELKIDIVGIVERNKNK